MNELLNELKFDDRGLIPVVTQDCRTDEVLMVAYMNKEALNKTLETGKVHYWSRSRNKLWLKGETSGHFQQVRSISIDCDGDSLLVKAEQKGAACHTGHHSCFYRKLDAEVQINENSSINEEVIAQTKDVVGNSDEDLSNVIEEVFKVVLDRKNNPKEGSYTNYLFDKGLDKILKKVGEEASEVIIASKNMNNKDIKAEIADLFYHTFVLMVERGMNLDDIYSELKGRR
jgi:phosphoribosyl-AMP cyclohydrolase / phosphoribosyl-ATP pyrophosphohydrolase